MSTYKNFLGPTCIPVILATITISILVCLPINTLRSQTNLRDRIPITDMSLEPINSIAMDTENSLLQAIIALSTAMDEIQDARLKAKIKTMHDDLAMEMAKIDNRKQP